MSMTNNTMMFQNDYASNECQENFYKVAGRPNPHPPPSPPPTPEPRPREHREDSGEGEEPGMERFATYEYQVRIRRVVKVYYCMWKSVFEAEICDQSVVN